VSRREEATLKQHEFKWRSTPSAPRRHPSHTRHPPTVGQKQEASGTRRAVGDNPNRRGHCCDGVAANGLITKDNNYGERRAPRPRASFDPIFLARERLLSLAPATTSSGCPWVKGPDLRSLTPC
jgi:hypothetical protein